MCDFGSSSFNWANWVLHVSQLCYFSFSISLPKKKLTEFDDMELGDDVAIDVALKWWHDIDVEAYMYDNVAHYQHSKEVSC